MYVRSGGLSLDENTKINELDITDEFLISDKNVKVKIIAKKLRKLGEGGVVLITQDNDEVVGFIRHKEIIDTVANGIDPAKMHASEIMNKDYVEVLEDEKLGNIMPIISKSYPNAIVVISNSRKCVGYFSESDYKEAMAMLGHYDESHKPKNAEDWRIKGIAMSSKGNVNDAMKCYEQSVKASPNKEHAWGELAKKLERLNKIKDAIKCYDKTVTINKENDKALTERGKLFSKEKTNKLAIHSYTLALSINPKNTEAMLSLAQEHLSQGEISKAIDYYDKTQEIDGESADLWFKKGNAFEKDKKYEKALECFENAIKMDEKFEEAWFNKGVVHYKMDDNESTLSCMQEILKINPLNESVKEAIAFYEKEGKFNFI